MKNINKYKGIINVFSKSKDFFKDYSYMPKSLLYRVSSEDKDKKTECGIILSNTNDTEYLKVEIPASGYLHLISYSKADVPMIPSHTGLLNIITNFFEIEFICAYLSDFDGIGDCNASLILTSEDKVFSVDAYLHDIIALSMVRKFPIFIRSSIYKKHGIGREELKGYCI